MTEDVRTERLLRRIGRLMAARLVLQLAVLLAALSLARVDRSFPEGADLGLYGTIVFAFLSTVAFAAIFPRVEHTQRFGAALIATDLIAISALVHYTGGSESVFAPLFVLVVVCAAVLFGRAGAYLGAALAATSFGAVLLAERIGALTIYGGAAPPVLPVEVAHWAVHAGAQVVVGLLASGLSRELDRTGEDLERSRSDLRRLRSLHERTVGSLLSGLLTTDTAGIISSFNPEAERITAISEAMAVGRPIDEILPGARACVMAPAESGRTGRTRARMLYKNRLGATLHLGLAASILREADGSAVGHVVIFQDVTQVVEMEGELRRSERQAAIGRLSAAIAHEIRNPLAAISGSIQMLGSASHVAGDDDSRRLMEIVLRETERLDGLITDFLQYARPAPPKLSSVALAPLVHELVEMFEKSRSPECPIEVRVEVPAPVSVTGDPSQLRQLLWNLYLNAAQAMPEGGRLLIAAKPAPAAPQDRSAAGRNAAEEEGTPFVELVVADTGIGIAPEVIDRIFDPFFTTRREGSGLGLATVHRIVESHGGSLRVESTVGSGTTFRIRLPQAEEPQ
jgi:two-component system sensor histidine kinase PilS (NtrC family)